MLRHQDGETDNTSELSSHLDNIRTEPRKRFGEPRYSLRSKNRMMPTHSELEDAAGNADKKTSLPQLDPKWNKSSSGAGDAGADADVGPSVNDQQWMMMYKISHHKPVMSEAEKEPATPSNAAAADDDDDDDDDDAPKSRHSSMSRAAKKDLGTHQRPILMSHPKTTEPKTAPPPQKLEADLQWEEIERTVKHALNIRGVDFTDLTEADEVDYLQAQLSASSSAPSHHLLSACFLSPPLTPPPPVGGALGPTPTPAPMRGAIPPPPTAS